MKRWVCVASVLVMVFGLFQPIAFCEGGSADTPAKESYRVALPDELREIVNRNREIVFPQPHPGLMEIVKAYRTPDLDEEKDKGIAEILRQSNAGDSEWLEFLTHDEILYEIDFLFDLMKYSYAAYEYFGGDEVFDAVKQLMLVKLSRMNDPVRYDAYVDDLLAPCLRSVIIDNHFRIGYQCIGIDNQLFMNETLIVHKDENGFITTINERVYRVLRAGNDFSFLFPTITRDGEFAYAFGWLTTSFGNRGRHGVGVVLEDLETQERITQVVGVFPISNQYIADLSRDTFTATEIDGIAMIENRRLTQYDDGGPSIEQFAQTGRAMRDEPVLILDLRGNEGGNGMYAANWVKWYADLMRKELTQPFAWMHLSSLTANEFFPYASAASPPTWKVTPYSIPTAVIPNNHLLIVLIDNLVMSSGEGFVAYLRELENVVFVGTSTKGCLVAGSVGSCQLPISRQPISFGIGLNIRPDLSQFEGVGFMPDLWVPPGESLERVVKFVERYRVDDQ